MQRVGFDRNDLLWSNRKVLFMSPVPDVDLRPGARQLPELASEQGLCAPASVSAGSTAGKRRHKARPSLYRDEIADQILGGLRAGRPLHGICRDDGMPCYRTIIGWVRQDRAGFAARYRQAREIGHGSPGPVRYTREIADRFLADLMCGRTLAEICGDPDMPDHTTINRWVAADREDFAARYRSAREIGHLRHAAVRYSPETADRILDELMVGKLLSDVCNDLDMPSVRSLRKWVQEDREGFRARYLEAREIGFQAIADEILKIIDDRRNDWIVQLREDGTTELILDPYRVKRAELRVKARCWLLSKMLPKTFGGRQDITAP
jgi:hypothetical protein